MPHFDERYECDKCGRDIESAFYFRDDGEDAWKYSANAYPNEPDQVLCSRCHGNGAGGR